MTIEISIIIPTLNNSAKLTKCLEHIERNRFIKAEWEVIVVDNGSIDITSDVVNTFHGKIKNIYYILEKSSGLMAARHRGVFEARGDIIGFIDDDSLVSENWIANIYKEFSQADIYLMTGPILPLYELKPPYWMDMLWDETEYGRANGYLSLIDFGDKNKIISPTYVLGCNFIIKKDIFISIGGSNPDYYPEDKKKFQGTGESGATQKLENLGYKAKYSTSLWIYHLVPEKRMNVEYIYRRAFFIGIGASYSNMRKKFKLDYYDHNLGLEKKNIIKLFIKKFLLIYQYLKESLSIYAKYNAKEIREIRHIKKEAKRNMRLGYEYHKRELNIDNTLREWVLRKNYLNRNGDLPELLD